MTQPDLDELAQLVGPSHVLLDAGLREPYEIDWTRRYRGEALAVVRPGDTAEVAAVVRWCAARQVPLVPQGGNTGLVGGAVPRRGAVVVSLRRLDDIASFDSVAGQITVGAGATPALLADELAGTGWEFGVDLGARDSATFGGMIATNAGGVRVLRHGSMRANVLGVEAVMADGTVISHLGGLLKDNTGYDVAGLLCGSEGTLGLITRARLRLVPEPARRLVVWSACESWADAVALAARARRELDGLEGLEAVDDQGLLLVQEQCNLPPLFGGETPPVALLIAWAGATLPGKTLATLVADRKTVAAPDDPGIARLWAYRDRQTESIARLGVPHKLDVTLPVAELARFTDEATAVVRPDRLFLFGHLGDGNLHLNIIGPAPQDDTVDARILHLVSVFGGSISAEHGIGRAKKRWLHLSRSPAELAVFRALKAALDPDGVLNPGVLL